MVSHPAPPIQITEIQIGQEVLNYPERDFHEGKLHVPHDENLLRFSFTALDFRNPGNNQYRFKLEGFETSWRQNNSNNQAVYTNLPAGEYRFRVQAADRLGGWAEEGASIPVEVARAPWQHPLAMIAYGTAIFLMALLVWHAISRRHHRDTTREVEQERRYWAKRLHHLSSHLAGSLTPEQTMERLLLELDELLDSDGAVVFLEESEQFRLLGMRGDSDVNHALERAPILLPDAIRRCRESEMVEALNRDELRIVGYPNGDGSYAVMVPLRASGEQFGVLFIARKAEDFAYRERLLLSAAATQSMMVLENVSLHAERN
nr:triple tyrosine motif-containing protein [Natronospira proteinivora]